MVATSSISGRAAHQQSLRVVGTGGTIASLADPETGAVRPAVGARELIAGVPGLEAFGPIEVDEVDRVSGWNVTPQTMLEVARRAAAAREDAVVVTHGTDTVEETAFFCDVTVERPVAFAAAMRSGDELGADGPRNLLAAARAASSVPGTVLVMNDEIHAARWARKLHSRNVAAFASPGHGPLGVGATLPRWTVAPPAALDRPVPVLQTYTGIEDEVFDVVLDATGAAGVVLEGTGLGNVPGSVEPGIRAALERGLPVVAATRVPTGGTGAVYGGPGGGVTLRDAGVIPAGGLSAAKARLLLMLLLARGDDPRAGFEDALGTLGCST
jgi:L-asparaginase